MPVIGRRNYKLVPGLGGYRIRFVAVICYLRCDGVDDGGRAIRVAAISWVEENLWVTVQLVGRCFYGAFYNAPHNLIGNE